MPLLAAWMRSHLNRGNIVWLLNLPDCTCPNVKEKTNQLNALK